MKICACFRLSDLFFLCFCRIGNRAPKLIYITNVRQFHLYLLLITMASMISSAMIVSFTELTKYSCFHVRHGQNTSNTSTMLQIAQGHLEHWHSHPLHLDNFNKVHSSHFLRLILLWFTDGHEKVYQHESEREAEMSFKCFCMESHLFSLKGKLWKVNSYKAGGGSNSPFQRQ